MSGRLDSNQRPLRPERSALPGCATARFIRRGLMKTEKLYQKMSAFVLVNRNYGGRCRDDWIRTSDHQHPMLVRYRTALRPENSSRAGGKTTG